MSFFVSALILSSCASVPSNSSRIPAADSTVFVAASQEAAKKATKKSMYPFNSSVDSVLRVQFSPYSLLHMEKEGHKYLYAKFYIDGKLIVDKNGVGHVPISLEEFRKVYKTSEKRKERVTWFARNLQEALYRLPNILRTEYRPIDRKKIIGLSEDAGKKLTEKLIEGSLSEIAAEFGGYLDVRSRTLTDLFVLESIDGESTSATSSAGSTFSKTNRIVAESREAAEKAYSKYGNPSSLQVKFDLDDLLNIETYGHNSLHVRFYLNGRLIVDHEGNGYIPLSLGALRQQYKTSKRRLSVVNGFAGSLRDHIRDLRDALSRRSNPKAKGEIVGLSPIEEAARKLTKEMITLDGGDGMSSTVYYLQTESFSDLFVFHPVEKDNQ